MKSAVVTAVRGRASHLSNQREALRRSDVQVGRHVLVAVDDDDVQGTVRRDDESTMVVPFRSASPGMPMAAARNRGARIAIDAGAEVLIFLDVDCIPAPNMIGRYISAAEHPDHCQALLCGPVTYLGPPGSGGYDLGRLRTLENPHPLRPFPNDEEILTSTEYELFWSLSFAVTTSVWQRIGGFCTEYTGYGAEDTDFGQEAAARSIEMRWVGGAHAFHQFHPISDPPVEHLRDIVRNAHVFHRRWGWWPMEGWLKAFEELGLIGRDQRGRPSVPDGDQMSTPSDDSPTSAG